VFPLPVEGCTRESSSIKKVSEGIAKKGHGLMAVLLGCASVRSISMVGSSACVAAKN